MKVDKKIYGLYGKNLQYLLEDWKATVVNPVISTDNTEMLAEYAMHLARILAYPGLDVGGTMQKIDDMGDELRHSVKSYAPLRPTQLIEKINEFFYRDKNFKSNTLDYYNP